MCPQPFRASRRIRSGAAIATLLCGGIVTRARPAVAADLGAVSQRTRPAVVHLSIRDSAGRQVATGSGFVVSADGRVVTNLHVVDGASSVQARLDTGRTAAVRGVLASDREWDVAVIQLEGDGYSSLPLGSSKSLRAGDAVIVIGSPEGLSGTLSTGIVSAIRDEGAGSPDLSKERREYRAWAIQITAPISPGSSGSPVMTENGEVVAVAVGQISSGQALNFCVPIERVVELLKRLDPAARPQPFPKASRSPTTNLAISAVVFGLLGVGLWLGSRQAPTRKARLPGVR
jgi:S1-C subfamily serine protease